MEAVTSPARARSGTRSTALVQTVDIETPELVTFSYTIDPDHDDGIKGSSPDADDIVRTGTGGTPSNALAPRAGDGEPAR